MLITLTNVSRKLTLHLAQFLKGRQKKSGVTHTGPSGNLINAENVGGCEEVALDSHIAIPILKLFILCGNERCQGGAGGGWRKLKSLRQKLRAAPPPKAAAFGSSYSNGKCVFSASELPAAQPLRCSDLESYRHRCPATIIGSMRHIGSRGSEAVYVVT